MAPHRKKLQVVSVNAGKDLSRRLMELGFCDSAEVTIVRSQTSGPLIIQLNNSRFALGRGMAMKIIVKVAPEKK